MSIAARLCSPQMIFDELYSNLFGPAPWPPLAGQRSSLSSFLTASLLGRGSGGRINEWGADVQLFPPLPHGASPVGG